MQRVTHAQAVERLNAIVDKANAQIAKAVAAMHHWETVAGELAVENDMLRSANAEMARQIDDFESEVSRLKKRLRKKAGKRREAWLGDDE